MRHHHLSCALVFVAFILGACGSNTARPTLPAPTAAAAAPAAPATEAERFLAGCRAHLDAARALRTQVVSAREPTVAAVLDPYNDLLIHLSNATNQAGLLVEVHPDATVRDAATTCAHESAALATELNLDRQLHDAIQGIKTDGLDADTRRFIAMTLRDFHRAGVDTDAATRARLKTLADEENDLQLAFERNVNDDVRKIEVDPADLSGLPADYIAAHPAGPDGKVKISTDYPDSIPFRTFARSVDARKRLYIEFLNRGYPRNDEVLHKLLAVRAEEAKLLGYATYADFVTEDKMIGSARNAQDFIDKIAGAADARMKKDYAALLARKRRDDPKATVVADYERAYYEELVNREEVGFDAQSVRPYFDFFPTRDGLLAITSQLFGVEYKKIDDAPRWHPDVDVYDVFQEGAKVGRIYLDLHPRANKFKHAACFAWVSGVEGKQLPEAALVANFPDPRATGGAALMGHDDVEVMFHEFGHLMHDLLSGKQRWVYFSGNTVFDFVEAPSQMFEEWASDPSTLALFARHYQTHEPMPADLIAKMRAADKLGKGIDTRIQMFYAAFSLRAHQVDPAKVDFLALVKELQSKYSPFAYVDGTHFPASFGHITEYSAMYYTYMWSLVIAKDLLSEFKKHGLLDPTTSRRYREAILVPGNSREAAESVKLFLGRPYGFDSFKRWLDGN